MEMTHTINVEFDLVLSMALFEGYTIRAETHASFTYDLKLESEADDEAHIAAVTEFLNTDEMVEQEKEAGHELVDLIASRMNTIPFTVKEVKNVVVTKTRGE